MLASAYSFSLVGIDAFPVRVEVNVSEGQPDFTIVGLPATSIRESRGRIATALRNAGYDFPTTRIIVNLAPAGVPKSGTLLDLPIAIGILAASDQIEPEDLKQTFLVGELSLDGLVRRVRGVLSMAIRCRDRGWRFLVPEGNGAEAQAIRGIPLQEAGTLEEVVGKLTDGEWQRSEGIVARDRGAGVGPCFSQVRGQIAAKRAMEIAAAGGHNVLMMGPPGAGKTLLAGRLPGILPELNFDESIEVTRVHSSAGLLESGMGLLWRRPFRAPHHSCSAVGLAGGGRPIRPGEISQAHRGVLFLDELPEFPRHVLEILRQPLENGEITLVRAGLSVRFPARFTLVAAMNPCPCGRDGSNDKPCRCTEGEKRRYKRRISGPLMDRFDLHVQVSAVELEDLERPAGGETSLEVRRRVIQSRKVQARRQGPSLCNAALRPEDIDRWCRPNGAGQIRLRQSFQEMGLSARSYHRILKVARTIADLADGEGAGENSSTIGEAPILEALQYRIWDRED